MAGLCYSRNSLLADPKVDTHPQRPVQIRICLQSRQTLDPGSPTRQPTDVGHTQYCAAPVPLAVIPSHFLEAKNAFLHVMKEPPSNSSWVSSLEIPAPSHNINVNANLNPWNGSPERLSLPNVCPVRYYNERTRFFAHPPFPNHMIHVPFSSRSNSRITPRTHHFHKSATYVTYVVLRWYPSSALS